jgi:DNA polymerase-3 subunit chi
MNASDTPFMSEIGFYHLTRSSAEQALPRLLLRALSVGQRCLVVCSSNEQVAALDDALWSAPDSWLPHGSMLQSEKEQRHATRQPIWISTNATPVNGATFLFAVDGAATEGLQRFQRIFDLFDGRDSTQVAAARIRWTAAKSAAMTPVYWRQTATGWEQAA